MHIRLVTEGQFDELARMGSLKEALVDGVPAWDSADIPSDVPARFPRKIDRVKDALQAAVERLRCEDRVSVVAFAGHALTLVRNTSGSQKDQLLGAIDELDSLRLGDETRIAEGIALGFKELECSIKSTQDDRGSSSLADRMIVLTDGFAFDQDECRAWARRARRDGIPISTMGMGGEFNEELMIPIADRTGGEAYLLQNTEDVPAAFAQELQRAQSICYRNLDIKLRPVQGVEVRAAYRTRPSIAVLEVFNEGGSYSFPLGDLAAGEKTALLLELILPVRPAGTYRLTKMLLAYDDPAGGRLGMKVRDDVTVHYTTDPARAVQRVPRVMRVVAAVSPYKLQRRAGTDLRAGNVAGATQKLRAAATRLLDMGEEALAAQMEQQAQELDERGRADSHRTKRLRYETRKLSG
jgi:hypothetical protein